jgi:chlorite dismutase
MAETAETRRSAAPLDISEKGGTKNGQPQRSNERLFMQLVVFGGCADPKPLVDALAASGLTAVLYEDVNDPRGIALLTVTEDPAALLEDTRTLLRRPPFDVLVQKHEFTMLGRTYSIGYEMDLKEVLIDRPMRTVLNPSWRWAVWYPLRRSGRFAQLPVEEQRVILAEHGAIGISFGSADYAHDIRLACHGLSKDDNDFVVGLVGKELYPLSAIVQTMRKTQQTSLYLERLGPFFVGRALWQARA